MIYALCDFDLLQKYNLSCEDFINRCYELDVEIVQYRDKNFDLDKIKERLLLVRRLWDKTLIVNDYIELAEYCNGVHIGQGDLKKYGTIESIRDVIGDKILGLSTHNKEEVLKANQMELDYIGLGAYRETTTKDVSSIGGEKLENIAKEYIKKTLLIFIIVAQKAPSPPHKAKLKGIPRFPVFPISEVIVTIFCSFPLKNSFANVKVIINEEKITKRYNNGAVDVDKCIGFNINPQRVKKGCKK